MTKHQQPQASACCVYDFTASANSNDCDGIKTILKEETKKWTFQHELTLSGYSHYQGRFSLKLKERLDALIRRLQKTYENFNWNISLTSSENHTNDFYVIKSETKVDGPWANTDKVIFIQPFMRDFIPRPYQQQIVDSALLENRDYRTCDVIYDPVGCSGKSMATHWVRMKVPTAIAPPISCVDGKEIIQMVCNITRDQSEHDPKIMIFDMPRALNKEKLDGMYHAIEVVKNGSVCDMRNHFKSWDFVPPRIWVFTNVLPNLTLLSKDRWRIWTINHNDWTLIKTSVDEILSKIKPRIDTPIVRKILTPILPVVLAHKVEPTESDDYWSTGNEPKDTLPIDTETSDDYVWTLKMLHRSDGDCDKQSLETDCANKSVATDEDW